MVLRNMKTKVAKLTGIDGNVFSVIGTVNKYLRRENVEKSKEYMDNVVHKGSYDEVLVYSVNMLESVGYEVQ